MKKATTLIIFSIFIVLMSMAAVCADENATDSDVLNAVDAIEDDVICDSESATFDDLSDLINGDNDVIELNDDYKYFSTDSVAKGGIIINRPVTINGNGHTIDASNSVRIFIVNSSNVIFNNISFINGYTSDSGGAIGANPVENLTINNCNFSNNAAEFGSAVYSTASSTKINNCNFENNNVGTSGGAVYVNGRNNVINNSNFTSNSASYGGAIYFRGENGLINNCHFDSNEAAASAGAVYIGGSNAKINGTTFTDNSATFGGSIFSAASYTTIDNSNFDENTASRFGGAIYFYASYPTVKNTKFSSNKVTGGSGGAIYSDDRYNLYQNVTFEKNEANAAGGALALISASYAKVDNCYFDSNSVIHHGAGIYSTSYGCEVTNSTFINCNAASGAGIYMVYSETNTNSYSYANVRDSKFINNTARYGGAGISATSHATISNSEFTGNSAGNYGGAVDLTHARMINSTLKNNSAIYGGAVYIHSSDVINSTFNDNVAEVGNAIYILNSSNLDGNDVLDEDVFLYDDDYPGRVVSNTHNIQSLMTTDQGFYAYCSERYNLSPYAGVYDGSLEKLKNSINHQPVAEYLKILIYYYVDNFEDLRNYNFANYVWDFTDFEYWNSTDPVVSEVVRLYNSGLRVSTENGCKVLSNGTLMYFNFSSLVTPSGEQNLFLFKFWSEDVINETLTKEALINQTVYLGDSVEYRIVINNKGSSPVYDNWVEDTDYSEGLVYKTWRSEVGNWTYNENTGRWHLDVLQPGQSASIILTFGVTLDGLLYNNATSGLGVTNVTNSGTGFKAYNRNMTVEKRTITPQVNIGDQSIFEIVVTNTGEIDLDHVFVCESEYDSGLVYIGYSSKVGTWKHSTNKEGKHVFTLDGILEVDDSASFRVIFKTTRSGNLSNTVVAGFNDTVVSNSTNTTEVLGDNTTNDTQDETVEENKTTTSSGDVSENIISEQKTVLEKEIDEKATGNPLLALILALILIPLRRLKK